MKKILLLGAAGMAGHLMSQYLKEQKKYDLIKVGHHHTPDQEGVNALDLTEVESILKKHHPDIVINCIGMLVKPSQDFPCDAIRINSLLPNFLSEQGAKYHFRLIHISTDCVFSGQKGTYRENDLKDGDTFYAKTKALGEVINERDLTIRTSIIGPELKKNGTGLLNWFLHQTGTIKGYSNAFWSGVTTYELAKATEAAIEQNLTGLYHLTMPHKISKFHLLQLFQKVFQKDEITVQEYSDYHCDKSLICTRRDFDYNLPQTYEIMLQELADWMQKHPSLYDQYSTEI